MDLFWSMDHELYVGHPRRLRAELGHDPWKTLIPSEGSLSPSGPPDILSVSRLLDLAKELKDLHLALDLKGSDRPEYHELLQWLRSGIVERKRQKRVFLWTNDAKSVPLVKRRVRFGKKLSDAKARAVDVESDCSSLLTTEDHRVFDILGPSRTCANPLLFLSEAARPWRRSPRLAKGSSKTWSGYVPAKGYVAWVDDEADLRFVTTHDADEVHVVSNRPLYLQSRLDANRAERCAA